MKLTLNKEDFVANILAPVSKLSDNVSLDTTSESVVKTLVSSSDNSVILMAKASCKIIDGSNCIIPDCKTFLRLFSGIEQPNVTLDINNNSITYKDPSLSFKYHLLDESYFVAKKSVNEDKLNQISYDTSFVMTKQKFSELIKFNSIVPDAEKLYFYTEKEKVYATIGDKQKNNTNEVTTEISSSFTGQALLEDFPINMQNILLFLFNSNEIIVKLNHQLKVFKFETSSLTYIVSGLVK